MFHKSKNFTRKFICDWKLDVYEDYLYRNKKVNALRVFQVLKDSMNKINLSKISVKMIENTVLKKKTTAQMKRNNWNISEKTVERALRQLDNDGAVFVYGHNKTKIYFINPNLVERYDGNFDELDFIAKYLEVPSATKITRKQHEVEYQLIRNVITKESNSIINYRKIDTSNRFGHVIHRSKKSSNKNKKHNKSKKNKNIYNVVSDKPPKVSKPRKIANTNNNSNSNNNNSNDYNVYSSDVGLKF